MFKLNEIKINYMIEPLTIKDNVKVIWNYDSNCLEEQKSYQIIVKNEDSEIIYDTGIVESSIMEQKLEGIILPSRHRFSVLLKVISKVNSIEEKVTFFETTLRDDEWKGKWTSIPDSFNGGTLYFRKQFKLENKKIKKARCYVCGIGYHELYINGRKVKDVVLNPGVTNYDLTLLYDTYELESFLENGDNVMGVEVGYGWYGSRKLLLQLYVTYEDGTEYEDHSTCNYGWWVSGTPIIDNSIYGGEIYDARKEELTYPHWCKKEFQPTWANGWMYTILTQNPVGKLTPQEIPPIRVIKEFDVYKTIKIDDKHIVFDFNQNMAGWAKISLKGERGSKVTLVYAEGLKEDNHVNQLNLRSARCSDTYILKGEGIETYSPRFTYHGFQFAEAIIEGKVEIISIKGIHVHSDVSVVGSFKCSDEILNRLHYMAVITEQNNQYSILTDCPQRDERFGWLNDVSSRQFQSNFNFDMDRFYNKVVHDISETQSSDGAIADTAPYYTGGQPADTTTASYLLLALYSYKLYGDKDLIIREYDNLKRWVEYLLTRQKDYIMDYYYYADWVPPQTLKNSNSDGIFVSSLFLHWHLKLIAELAKIASKEEDYNRYSKMVIESKEAINKKYYHEDTHSYSLNTQCENAMAIWLDVCKEENKKLVFENVVKDIIDNNYHITCGNQGYRHVFYLLAEYGYGDLAIKVLKNEEYPGWGYMVKMNASTIWERWEAEMQNEMHSFDHPMFGSFDAMFYHYFGGIQYDGNGCDETIIHPYVVQSLEFVETSFKTIKGTFVSNWKKIGTKIEYYIEIPVNLNIKVIIDRDIESINGTKVSGKEFSLSGGHYTIISK